MVEHVRTAFVNARRTISAHIDEVTVAGAARAEGDITADVKIQAAIAVVIEESSPTMKLSAGLGGRNAGLVSDIGERTVAVVVVQDIAAVLGDVEIGETVVVVVPPDAT